MPRLAPPAGRHRGGAATELSRTNPAVELAALPVGGSGSLSSSSPKCVDVSWSGQALRDGVQDPDHRGRRHRRFRGSRRRRRLPGPMPRQHVRHGQRKVQCQGRLEETARHRDDLHGRAGLARRQCVAPDAVTCQQVQSAVNATGSGPAGPAVRIGRSNQHHRSSSSSEASQFSVEELVRLVRVTSGWPTRATDQPVRALFQSRSEHRRSDHGDQRVAVLLRLRLVQRTVRLLRHRRGHDRAQHPGLRHAQPAVAACSAARAGRDRTGARRRSSVDHCAHSGGGAGHGSSDRPPNAGGRPGRVHRRDGAGRAVPACSANGRTTTW